MRTASLRQAYTASIKAFSGLLGLRSAKMLDHSKRVASTAMKMAQLAGLDHAMAQDIFIAGLLHDLGKIGLSDRVLNTYIDILPQSDFVLLESHAAMGATCLKGLEGMDTVSQMIRSHHENFDVIISDMQMPSMNGAQLLQQVRQQWPQTMRILLTGTADLANAGQQLSLIHIRRCRRRG